MHRPLVPRIHAKSTETQGNAAKIVRSLESIAETQPKLQPALLRLSAIISHYFTLIYSPSILSTLAELVKLLIASSGSSSAMSVDPVFAITSFWRTSVVF
jgi:hypothetical protein